MRGKRKQTCSWPIMTHTWFYCDQSCVFLLADALAIASIGFLFRYNHSCSFPHIPKSLNSTEHLSFIPFPTATCDFFFFFAISRCCINQKCLLFDLHSKHKICFKKGLTILNEWHFPGRTYCTESTTIRHKTACTFWASTENSAVGAGAMVFPSRQRQIRFNPSSMQLACWHPE